MWTLIGLLCALGLAAVAAARSRAGGGYYDAGVYGMTPRTHRRYAAIGLAFACFFALALMLGWGAAGVAALALYAVIAIFYASSFLRGASDE